MPRTVLVDDTSTRYHPFALGALLAKLSFVAGYTDDVLSSRYETARSDQLMADLAAEALCMPLATLVFILLHACAKDVSAERTSGGESVFVARCAVELVVLVGERLVDERRRTSGTFETLVMPVLLLIRQILEVAGDRSLAFVAHVGEQVFVAFLAVGSFVVKDVSLSGQTDLAVETDELTTLPVLLQRLRKVCRE